MERKAIITGGAGFVGSHLADRLLELGFEVVIIDNLVRTNGTRNIDHIRDKITFIEDVASMNALKQAGDNVTHIFHLAATRINRCAKFPYEGHRLIAETGYCVVKYATEIGAKLFFASTASVYNKPKIQPITEDSICAPHTIYGAGKYYTENLIRSFDNMHGLDYTINRFFSVYGERMDCEGAYTEVIFNWLYNISQGNNNITVYGDPNDKILDLVYVDDVIDAILKTTFESNKDVFNVSTEQGVTLSNLINVIKDVTGKELNINIVPENRNDIEKKRVGSTKKLRELNWNIKNNLYDGIKKTHGWITTLE